MSRSVLIVDDDPVQRRLLEAMVLRLGHRARVADGGEAALDALDHPAGEAPALVLLDLVMPGLGGLAVLDEIRRRGLATPVIVQTARGGVDMAVRAMRAGAFDFVVKPVSPERLRAAVEAAFKVETAESAARRARGAGADRFSFDDLVGIGPEMERVVSLARKAAGTDIPVLIEGESGVGKELVAKAVRAASARRQRPFVTVNCGAIPDTLVESILFGHEKGAFTGATERHAGKFVEADGGTLFLDEVGDLPPSAQVKLLRAVQDGEIDAIGARQAVRVDIRLISATHRDLLQLVRDGHFREDLFYRLNVFPIVVPPLRRRRGDIPALVRHFLARLPWGEGVRRARRVSPAALDLLMSYDWPGNIRQLENAILRAAVLAEADVLDIDEFPQIRAQLEGIPEERLQAEAGTVSEPAGEAAEAAGPAPESPAKAAPGDDLAAGAMLSALDDGGNVRSLAEMEQAMIELAIDHYGGQMSEVARRLGIGRSTLYRKLKEFGIDPERRGEKMAS